MKVYRIVNEIERLNLGMFGLTDFHPVLLLNGKASKWTGEEYPVLLWSFFVELVSAITNIAEGAGPAVLTGATRHGVIKMFGEVCEYVGRYPDALIGITPQYFVEEEQVKLEEHHSHVVLTAGKYWEDAIPTMRSVRELIAYRNPRVLLAIDAGENTLKEMLAHAYDGVPLYILWGSDLQPQGFLDIVRGNACSAAASLYQKIWATHLVHFLDLSEPEESAEKLMEALGFKKKNGSWSNLYCPG